MTYFLLSFLDSFLAVHCLLTGFQDYFSKPTSQKFPRTQSRPFANAYMQAGFFAGTLSLLCELFKGAVPVFLADRILDRDSMLFALVMAAPVFGHAFPFFQKERGGKAIAVSFGVMIGLFPEIHPLFCLIFYYILFSLVLTLRPHSFRSVITYGLFTLTVFLFVPVNSIRLGCFIISAIVIYRHVIRCHDEALQALLFGKYPLFHKS